MKKDKLSIIAAILSLSLIFSSCEKVPDNPSVPENTTKITTAETTESETETATEQIFVTESEATTENPEIIPTETDAPVTEIISTISSDTTEKTTIAASTTAPAKVVIPDVKTVSSPGKKVFSKPTAMIDYSNASLGYISASYSGQSKKVKLRISCGDKKYDHNLSVGGKTEYFPLSMGSGAYHLQLFENVGGKSYLPVIDETVTININDEVSAYLYPNRYVNFDKNSQSVKKAAELCAGKTSDIEKLYAIFGYITSNVTYDQQLAKTVKSGYTPDPDTTLSKKTGICFDYASLFAAMARSQGIPTRLAVGYASPDIYHAWNEVYTKETGWISVEIYLKNKGYNLVDSTFYASAKDKEQFAKYMADGKNYDVLYYY